ncbi:chlorite dismutase family protein [Petrachloros mirabilis]
MTLQRFVRVALLLSMMSVVGAGSSDAAADRENLLSAPGVYGTFAVYSLEEDWAKLETPHRIAQLTAMRGVVAQYGEKAVIDLYLLRGLSDHADIMFRIHALDLRTTQKFLVDLRNSSFGRYLKSVWLMNGLTKKANYVPSFSDQMKADLKGPSVAGPNPYAIVIPIRKSAEWWALDQQSRTSMMQEHTAVALPYQKTIKRKLYHSTGLDGADFITYFETANLEEFQNLILALKQVKEFQYSRRFGHPIWLGTAKSVDEIIETFAQ